MPTYNQASFISRAIKSLQLQSFKNWELIIINDGSTDATSDTVKRFLEDQRITYYKEEYNQGLGYALNLGLSKAKFDLIAYLPSDDIYYKEHLQTLHDLISSEEDIALAISSVLHHGNQVINNCYGEKSNGIVKGYPLQLVQALHHKTEDRWIERDELVTDDLNKLFWEKLLTKKDALENASVTCEWVDHPHQRHKLINDRLGGGIYVYKQYYNVKQPIRFKSIVGNYIDEISYYQPFRNIQPAQSNGLKILIVGDLAYNPERIYAFEQLGHKLYGLWSTRTSNHNAVGPFSFGAITDLSYDNWKEEVCQIKPDVIYALVSHLSVPFVYDIFKENEKSLNIPFVWHFKEGPSYCRFHGSWSKLIELYSKADGRIYTNEVLRDWFEQFLPDRLVPRFILDPELPKKEWFTEDTSPLISTSDGEIHTVFVGRPVGLTIEDILTLAEQKIHLHFYGDIFHFAYGNLLQDAIEKAPSFIHLHPNCTQDRWVNEFSKYDAAWLHIFESQNFGELLRASWHDLNSPARLSTYAMAGLPMLQKANPNHTVASQLIAQKLNIGCFFDSFKEVGEILRDKQKMSNIRKNVWQHRRLFSFDFHVKDLIEFFIYVIKSKS